MKQYDRQTDKQPDGQRKTTSLRFRRATMCREKISGTRVLAVAMHCCYALNEGSLLYTLQRIRQSALVNLYVVQGK